MDRKPRQCVGCNLPFIPSRGNQRYHSPSCRDANPRDKTRPKAGRPDPHPTATRLFGLAIKALRPPDAIGYRLYCQALNCVLPIPRMQRRNGTRPAHGNFSLDPLEIPLIPLDVAYVLVWIYPGDAAAPSDPPQRIRPGWVDDGLAGTKGLGYLLKMHDQINGKSLRIAKFQRTEHENVFITHLFYPAPPTNHLEQTVVSELPEPEPGDSGDKSGGAE